MAKTGSKHTDFNAIILAGGKSSRMHTEKCLLKIENKSFLRILYDRLKTISNSVIISSNNLKTFEDAIIVKDNYEGLGPIAGLEAALSVSDKQYNIVTPCDMPLLTQDFFSFLIEHFDADVYANIIKYDNRIYPLTGIYSKKILPRINLFIKNKYLKIMALSDSLEVNIINIPENKFSSDIFINFNTPEDLKKLKTKK